MDPMTMMMLMKMAGQAMSLVGEYKEAKAQSRQLEYQAHVAQIDAQNIERAGNLEEGRVQTAARGMLARQVAIAAAAGRDISGGSPLALMEATEREFVMDEQIVNYNKNMAVGRKNAEAILAYGTSRSIMAAAKNKLMFGGLMAAGKQGEKSFPQTTKVTAETSETSGHLGSGPKQNYGPSPFARAGASDAHLRGVYGY